MGQGWKRNLLLSLEVLDGIRTARLAARVGFLRAAALAFGATVLGLLVREQERNAVTTAQNEDRGDDQRRTDPTLPHALSVRAFALLSIFGRIVRLCLIRGRRCHARAFVSRFPVGLDIVRAGSEAVRRNWSSSSGARGPIFNLTLELGPECKLRGETVAKRCLRESILARLHSKQG